MSIWKERWGGATFIKCDECQAQAYAQTYFLVPISRRRFIAIIRCVDWVITGCWWWRRVVCPDCAGKNSPRSHGEHGEHGGADE